MALLIPLMSFVLRYGLWKALLNLLAKRLGKNYSPGKTKPLNLSPLAFYRETLVGDLETTWLESRYELWRLLG